MLGCRRLRGSAVTVVWFAQCWVLPTFLLHRADLGLALVAHGDDAVAEAVQHLVFEHHG